MYSAELKPIWSISDIGWKRTNPLWVCLGEIWIQSYTFQGKAKLDGKKPNWNTLVKSKNIRRPKTHQKAKTVVKSSVKWDAGTGKCSFMLIFSVLVATGPNCLIASLLHTCTVEINPQKHFMIAKGLQKQSKQCRQSVLLDDVIKLWSPKWYIEIWATWDCRSLWCSRDLLAACTTELYTRSADLTALVCYKRLSKLLKFGGVALM